MLANSRLAAGEALAALGTSLLNASRSADKAMQTCGCCRHSRQERNARTKSHGRFAHYMEMQRRIDQSKIVRGPEEDHAAPKVTTDAAELGR